MSVLAALTERLLSWLIAAALFVMMALTCLDVLGRYVVNRPMPGAAELVQYMLVATVFLALPVVTFREEHISISLIDDWLGPAARRVQRALLTLASAVVFGTLAVRLWMHAGMNATNRDVIGFLNLPVAPAAFLASVFCGLTVLVLAALIILRWTDGARSNADRAPTPRLVD